MIIVRLVGGLGNQLFQYATARRLAVKSQVKLKLDIGSFKNDRLREFSLASFNIKGNIASENESLIIKAKDGYLKYLPGFRKLIPQKFKRILRSPVTGLNEKILHAGKEHYLNGYWAHENYFKDIRPILLEELTLKAEFHSEEFKGIQDILQQEDSVSIHIRRGDYASNEHNQSFFGLISMDYYQQAIDSLLRKVKRPAFYIFTDDVGWVRGNLKTKVPLIFIQEKGKFTDCQELVLMSYCKHNIIANSSFSWWGAWLNRNTDKIVIAPERWYNDPIAQANYKQLNFIPKNWTKL